MMIRPDEQEEFSAGIVYINYSLEMLVNTVSVTFFIFAL